MHFSAIQLSSEDLKSLYAHAEQSLPNESVALLFGIIQDYTVTVTHVELVENVVRSPSRFEVDPVVEYNLLLRAERLEIEMIGIFHSHPAPPQPSVRDIANMKLNRVVWLIASKLTGEWVSRAFHFKDKRVTEITCMIN